MPSIPVNIPVLSAQDRSILKRMIDDWRHAPKAAPGRGSTLPEPAKQAPDVYIALTPPDGIPARVGLIPGSAECAIWKLSEGSLVDAGFTLETVTNLATSPVSGNEYVCVKRDKFETWIVELQGSGDGGGGSDPIGGFASIHETDIRCESGLLNLYNRAVTISVIANQLTSAVADWVLSGVIGCCETDCVTTGTGADDMSWYCLTPISTVEVMCGGVPVQLPRLMCVSTRNIVTGEPAGDDLGALACRTRYANPVRMAYVGSGRVGGVGNVQHYWNGQDLSPPCARSFNVIIEEREDDCLTYLSGSLYDGVNENIGENGIIPAVVYPDAHTAYVNTLTDAYVFNPSVIGSYYLPINFVENRFSLDTDLYMVFATTRDYHAGLYVVTPCIENELVPGTGTTPAISASECHGPITRAQLQAILDSGYLLSAGPFPSSAECLAACQPPDTHTGTGSNEGFWYCMQTPDASDYGCLLLTIAELTELVDANWSILGGAFNTESECNDGCDVLTGTGTFGRCPCGDLGIPYACVRRFSGLSVRACWESFPLLPVGAEYRATAFAIGSGDPLTLSVRCENGQYYATDVGSATEYHLRVINCAPLTLLYVDANISIRIAADYDPNCCESATGTGSGGGGGGVVYVGSVTAMFSQIFLDGAGPFPGITIGVPVSGAGLSPGTLVTLISGSVVDIDTPAVSTTVSVPYTFG